MMPIYPANVLEQARAVLKGWQYINPSLLHIDEFTSEMMQAEFEQAEHLIDQVGKLGNIIQLSDLYRQCDKLLYSLWDKTLRVRTVVRQIYGDDSLEYSMVSGALLREKDAH